LLISVGIVYFVIKHFRSLSSVDSFTQKKNGMMHNDTGTFTDPTGRTYWNGDTPRKYNSAYDAIKDPNGKFQNYVRSKS